MISSIALAALVAAPAFVAAHGQLSWVQIGGGQQYPAWDLDDYYTALYREKDPVYGRAPDQKYTRKTDSLELGFTDIYSNAIATGGYDVPKRFDDISAVGVVPAKAGDEVVIQWDHHWPAEGHPGPIGEWMAKCPGDSCAKVDATTLDWFSIAQHNWDADKKEWPTETLTRSLDRKWTFKLPTDLPGGAYLIRHSLIAYHNSTGPFDGLKASPQHYPIGIEITLESSGTNLPSETCKFPGCFSYDDYEWHHEIYDEGYNNRLGQWEFPGIGVYSGGYTTGVVNGKSAGQGSQGTPSTSPGTSSSAEASEPTSTDPASSGEGEASSTASESATIEPDTSAGATATSTDSAPATSISAHAAFTENEGNGNTTTGKTCKRRRKRSGVAIPKRHQHRANVLRSS
ncbi:hypothetical protein IAT38_003078 [Cryptococcus sp. DSM 104549]